VINVHIKSNVFSYMTHLMIMTC